MENDEEIEELDLSELLEKYMDQEKIFRLEGRVGIQNLAKIANALGYTDPMHFGQFSGGCFGDLIDFFEDNSGAIEAVIEWIGKMNLPEWRETIKNELIQEEPGENGN
jgi:hypothetical protein